MKKVMLASLIMLFSASAFAKEGLVLTWQNSYGKWFACGPIQCTSASNKTERKAMSYVVSERRHDVRNTYQTYGKCNVYKIKKIKSYDNSSKKVRRLAKC